MPRLRVIAVWLSLALAMLAPVAIAATSPLLQWRSPVYIGAGLAGVLGLSVMLAQPLLASAALPGLSPRGARQVHKALGVALVVLIALHVAGLWITSPPDVIDALTFTSATPFSAWGVIAMWAVFGAATLAALRSRLKLRAWRLGHTGLVSVAVGCTIAHALMIQGAMGLISKWILSALVLAALLRALTRLRIWRVVPPRRQGRS